MKSCWISPRSLIQHFVTSFMDKLSNCEIKRFALGSVMNWLDGCRVVVNGVTSGWWSLTSSVPQTLILRPVLFNVFISDLSAGLECILRMLADDTKLRGAVNSLEGQEALQRDPDKLEHWAVSNSMKSIKGKCQVLHLEQRNAGSRHRLGDKWWESSSAERSLGVLWTAGSTWTSSVPC